MVEKVENAQIEKSKCDIHWAFGPLGINVLNWLFLVEMQQ